MRVFVTGATGFIGSKLVPELIAKGHQVLGLARSDEGAAALVAAGAEVHRGSIEDLDSLSRGAAAADGVIHLAFNHDFSRFEQNCDEDRQAIEALGAALTGSQKPLLVTSGTAITDASNGSVTTEDDPAPPVSVVPRAASEAATLALADAGVRASIVRLPQVHDPRRQGLVSYAIQIAQQKGRLAYIGDGANRWPAAHVDDVARLYVLALEQAARGAVYHAVAEEGVTMRAIVETIAPRLGLPVVSIAPDQAADEFGWLAMFAARDLPASGAKTQAALGWTPSGPTMLEDLERLEV